LLEYNFLIYAFVGALLSGLSLAVLSPFVTLKRIAYLGEALSHIAFAGIALALVLGSNLSVTTTVFVLAIACLIGFVSRFYQTEETNVITIFLSVSMALGIILIALKKDYSFDLASYLFGNILLIQKEDLWHLLILAVLNLGFVVLLFKELFYMSYNMTVAEVYGIRVKTIYYGFLLLLALNIVIAVKIAGIILVTAQLILPASIAFCFSRKLKFAIVLSVVVSFISSAVGFYVSWILNLPTGAVIVLVQFFIYLLSLILKPMLR